MLCYSIHCETFKGLSLIGIALWYLIYLHVNCGTCQVRSTCSAWDVQECCPWYWTICRTIWSDVTPRHWQQSIWTRIDHLHFPCNSVYDPGPVFVNALRNCLAVSVTFYLTCKREGLEKSLLFTAHGLLLWFIAAGNPAPCSCSHPPGGMG